MLLRARKLSVRQRTRSPLKPFVLIIAKGDKGREGVGGTIPK
jgi:hypothetical protein